MKLPSIPNKTRLLHLCAVALVLAMALDSLLEWAFDETLITRIKTSHNVGVAAAVAYTFLVWFSVILLVLGRFPEAAGITAVAVALIEIPDFALAHIPMSKSKAGIMTIYFIEMLFLFFYAIFLAVLAFAWRRLCPRVPPSSPSNALRFRFNGAAKEYFKIMLANIALTVATLGVYSAWAKVRARRWFYGNCELGDSTFDYHANPKSILVARVLMFFVYALFGAGVLLEIWELLGSDPRAAQYNFLFLKNLSPFAAFLLLFYAWATARGAAFNARYSSFCGARFSFRADSRLPMLFVGAWILMPLFLYAAYVWAISDGHNAVVMIDRSRAGGGIGELSRFYENRNLFLRAWAPVVIGFAPYVAGILLLPAALWLFVKWRAQNHSLGKVRFYFTASPAPFYFFFLLLPLPLLLPFADSIARQFYSPMLFGKTHYFGWLADAVGMSDYGKHYRPFYQKEYAYSVSFFYALLAAAVMPGLFYGNLAFDGGRFRSGISACDYGFRIMLPNLILSIVSLGLLIPWARVRRAKYLAENIWIEASPGLLQSIKSTTEKSPTALGESAEDSAFDFDAALV